MKKYLCAFLLMTLLPLNLYANTQDKAAGKSYLFVQTAMQGELQAIKNEPGYYTLKLADVKKYTMFFTDRPARSSGMITTQAFFKEWQNNHLVDAFNKMPPNVAITAIVKTALHEEKTMQIILTLTDPVYKPKQSTIVYKAKPLNGVNLPASSLQFNDVALFIDDYCASCSASGF